MTDPDGAITQAQAAQILAGALAQPGGALSVFTQLGTVPTIGFAPPDRSGMFRRTTPARLAVGDWEFVAVEPAGVRIEVRHVVKGVPLQRTLTGPMDAGPQLAAEVFAAAGSGGPEVAMVLQSVLYGLAAVSGLG